MSTRLTIDAEFLLNENEFPQGDTFEAKGKTVVECINQYLSTHPHLKRDIFNKWGRLDMNIFVFINNQEVRSDQLQRELKDGDEIKITWAEMHAC